MRKVITIYKRKNCVTIIQENFWSSFIYDLFTIATLLSLQYISFNYFGNGFLISFFIFLVVISCINKAFSFEKCISSEEAIQILQSKNLEERR